MKRAAQLIAPSREQEIGRLRAVLERAHTPRFDMSLIVALTGASGLLASFLLLQGGVLHMGWRYLAALVIAYLVFLGLLWIWLRFRKSDFELPDAGSGDFGGSGGEAVDCPEPFVPQGGQFGGGGASGSFEGSGLVPGPDGGAGEAVMDAGKSVIDKLGGVAEADEAAVPLFLLAALMAILLALLVAAVSIVAGAPSLFAELLLDGVLAGGLYRRLRRLEHRHWLEVAVRRTAVPFLLAALVVCATGFAVHLTMPGAHTLSQAFAQFRGQ